MALTGAAAEHFERQADVCDRLGSPFTARLCRLLATILDETSETGCRIIGWPGDPGADALALRLCGGLHRLALSGAETLAAVYPPESAGDDDLERALRAALLRHDGVLRAALDRPPQTNEIARSAMLLPGFLAVARETGLPLQLAWLRMEPLDTADPFATLSLTLWPGGETRHLAHCDYHGRWLDWLA